MCHCKACDKEIEVKWRSPPDETGRSLPPILEDLCGTCLGWAKLCLPKQDDETLLPVSVGVERDDETMDGSE